MCCHCQMIFWCIQLELNQQPFYIASKPVFADPRNASRICPPPTDECEESQIKIIQKKKKTNTSCRKKSKKNIVKNLAQGYCDMLISIKIIYLPPRYG